MAHRKQQHAAGFTLVELLVGLAIFLVVSAALIGGMTSMQKNYRTIEVRTAMEQRLRGAMELMTQEINQAGLPTTNVDQNSLVTGALTTVSAFTLNPSATPPSATLTVPTGGSSNVFPNQKLWLDVGTNQEEVVVLSTTSTTITVTNFVNTHTAPFPVFALSVYAYGVRPNATDMAAYPPTAGHSSTYQLEFFGDLNTTGRMVYVRYLCPQPGTTDKLTRTVYDVTDATHTPIQGPETLLDNVSACQFTYDNSIDLSGQGFGSGNLITTIGVNITVRSQTLDPQTKSYITVTKSFLNIQPRSLNAGIWRFLNNGDVSTLEKDPTTGIFTSEP
jgi:prepilin-type N-terminal cleavage/methylation domain-containing protein